MRETDLSRRTPLTTLDWRSVEAGETAGSIGSTDSAKGFKADDCEQRYELDETRAYVTWPRPVPAGAAIPPARGVG